METFENVGNDFTRNAKFFGMELTPEFLAAFKKVVKIQNRISKEIRKLVSSGKIVGITKKGYIKLSDGTEITKARFKDSLSHVFPSDCVEKSESLKRELVLYVLERYAGYFGRNGLEKTPTIHIKGKGLYYSDNFFKIDKERKVITVPTLFGKFELKYNHALKEDLFVKKKFGGNLILRQKCMVAAVKVKFNKLYEPELNIGFDLNKTEIDWIVLDNGVRIPAPLGVSFLFSEIREINKDLDADKKQPVAKRKLRSKERRKKRLEWKQKHRQLRNNIKKVVDEIINTVIEHKACLCIDSVKCGQKMGTFGQDHLIPLLQTECENKGIPFHVVPCKDTSRRCSECGYIDKDNRVDTETFVCQSCQVKLDAQENGAKNIAWQGVRLNKGRVPYGNWAKRNIDKLIVKYSTQQKQV